MGRVIVSDEVELEVRRMLEELQRRALTGGVTWERAKPCVQALIEGRKVVAASAGDQGPAHQGAKSKRDLAEVYRAWFEAWYRSLGFTVTVPKPNVTNREFARRAKKHQELRYEPAASEVPYEAFMRAVGQGDHRTVTDADERAKIGWEPTATGYWHWADAQDDCPRLGTTWNDLAKTIRLLSLEEFVKHWHATKAGALFNVLFAQRNVASPSEAMSEGRGEVGAKEIGRMLDVRTWCWLRTRFGRGALCALGIVGRVYVNGVSADGLSIPVGSAGGRAADVV